MKKIMLLSACLLLFAACSNGGTKDTKGSNADTEKSSSKKSSKAEKSSESNDANSGASQSGENVDATTSASKMPDNFVQNYKPKGFSADDSKEKALFVVGDPRKYSVNYDLANTAMKYFEEQGVEVELRDLYDIKFNPVITAENFYNAKDGSGETPEDVKTEQNYVAQADHIIFVYPNWHDTPNAIVKGYMERVFAKKFAYEDGDKGLKGLLTDKDIYTIMNCGYLGGGRGYIGDGIGKNDELWDSYMEAFKIFDDDTAGFWGVKNKGRFMNDQTPANNSKEYEKEIEALRSDLKKKLDTDFFKK